MKRIKIAMITLMTAGLVGAGSVALAQPKGPGQGPCRADIERLCGGIEKGEGRIRQCMKENKDRLSPECRARIEKGKKAHGKLREACKEDHQKYCQGKRGKDGRKCMRENRDKFSASCKAAMKELREKRKPGKGKD